MIVSIPDLCRLFFLSPVSFSHIFMMLLKHSGDCIGKVLIPYTDKYIAIKRRFY